MEGEENKVVKLVRFSVLKCESIALLCCDIALLKCFKILCGNLKVEKSRNLSTGREKEKKTT